MSKETPALGHKGGTATCTAKAVCTRCNQPYGDPMGHDHVHHEAQAPTCTTPGWDTYDTCSRCDYTTTYAETPALGHEAVVDPAVAATCVEEGKTEGSHCSVCGKVLVEQTATEKNPNNHAAVERIGAEPATCDKSGYTGTLVCKACKLDGDYTRISEGVIIPALEHEYNDKGVCARCGKQKEPEVVSGGNS